MRPMLYIALTADWELRGNGTGNPRWMQFEPMRRLVRIFDQEGVRSTFNVEVMQQLAFRSFQDEYRELRELADEWDDVVLECYSKGHDMQLHIHPQWHGAHYEDGRWILPGCWQITNYPYSTARDMLVASKMYLERLLRRVNPNYRCVSHRAGSWCIAPSEYMVPLLAEIGIEVDISIVGGIRYHTRHLQLDYTNCEETFLPFYPGANDARRVADGPGALVCIPTNAFTAGLFNSVKHRLQKRLSGHTKFLQKSAAMSCNGRQLAEVPDPRAEWGDHSAQGRVAHIADNLKQLCQTHHISDIAQLDYALLEQMMQRNRERARASNWPNVPLVLENHPKDIADFSHIRSFARDLGRAEDVKTITLSELAAMLKSHKFPIRSRFGFNAQALPQSA